MLRFTDQIRLVLFKTLQSASNIFQHNAVSVGVYKKAQLNFTLNYDTGDFKIICDVPYNNFVPQPSVPREVGFGPSKICENAGLLCPSHEGGIVFFKPKEEHVIKFLTKDKVSLR